MWIETGKPTITLKSNSNTNWAKTGSVTVALQDSKSGLASGAKLKYGWSTSTSTEPSSYTDVTPSYTAGTTSEVTFTAEASGLTGKYYLWVVPTTLADTAGNTQTTTAKSTGQFYFDNKGPSAPTLTGGSTTYATSQTIKVSTASTDTGVGTVSYYEYYKASNSTAPTASTSGTKVTTNDNSITFSSNIAGHYVYFRGVDSLGNKGAWSSAARVYVDVNSPTVSAKNSSVTITAGDSVAMSSYFTTGANGNAGISSTTYKIGSTSYSNTSGLAAGTYTVTCTVTKVTGKTASVSMTLVVKAKVTLPTADTLLYSAGNTGESNVTITVPEGVRCVKVVVDNQGVLYANPNGLAPEWFEGLGTVFFNDLMMSNGGIYWLNQVAYTVTAVKPPNREPHYGTMLLTGTIKGTTVVGVTPGKSYTFSGVPNSVSVYYSQSINDMSPNVTDY